MRWPPLIGGSTFLHGLVDDACDPVELMSLAYRHAGMSLSQPRQSMGATPPERGLTKTVPGEPIKLTPTEPVETALYFWYDADDHLLYIGITGDLATRQTSHAKRSSWAEFADHSKIRRFPTRAKAEAAEKAAIEAEHPLFNHVHNDTPQARARLVAYLIEHGRTDLLAPAVSRG